MEEDIEPRQRGNLGDPAPHGAGADDADGSFHVQATRR